MFYVIPLILIVSTTTYVIGNNRQPPNASRLKTDLSKMRQDISKSGFKQQQAPLSQKFSPKFGDTKPTEQNGGLSTSKSSLNTAYLARGDIPRFSLFVRRLQAGPWSRFDDMLGDESIQSICEDIVINGGLEAEALRGHIDKYMISKLFGTDTSTNPSLLVNRIKGALPQFKKFRPRDLEIGYKLAAEGEEICSLTSLLIIAREEILKLERQQFKESEERQITILDQMHKAKALLNQSSLISLTAQVMPQMIPSPKLDIGEFLSTRQPTEFVRSHAWLTLQTLLESFVNDRPAGECDLYLCSDGSASMCQGGCSIASAGLFATFMSRYQYENENSNEVDGEEFQIDPQENAIRIHIRGVEVVVESPFDAELVAGLAAITVALEIAKKAGGKMLGKIVLLTDSKTLVRAVRTGPEGNIELAQRGGSQRRAIWAMLMASLKRIDETGVILAVQWTAGHPERKGGGKETWTLKDWAIWEADDIARAERDGAISRSEIDLTDLLLCASV